MIYNNAFFIVTYLNTDSLILAHISFTAIMIPVL